MVQHLELIDGGATPPVWASLRNEAQHIARVEPSLASILNAVILRHDRLGDALSYQLARKLGDQELRAMSLREIADEAYAADPDIVDQAEADLRATYERDPACKGYVQPMLFFKGFLALQSHRVGHWLWREGRETLAFYLQSRVSELFQVDIHPAASIGRAPSSTMAPASSSARPPSSATTCPCCMASRWAAPGPSAAIAIQRSAMESFSAPGPRCWATSAWATSPRWPPARSCSRRCRRIVRRRASQRG